MIMVVQHASQLGMTECNQKPGHHLQSPGPCLSCCVPALCGRTVSCRMAPFLLFLPAACLLPWSVADKQMGMVQALPTWVLGCQSCVCHPYALGEDDPAGTKQSCLCDWDVVSLVQSDIYIIFRPVYLQIWQFGEC